MKTLEELEENLEDAKMGFCLTVLMFEHKYGVKYENKPVDGEAVKRKVLEEYRQIVG